MALHLKIAVSTVEVTASQLTPHSYVTNLII